MVDRSTGPSPVQVRSTCGTRDFSWCPLRGRRAVRADVEAARQFHGADGAGRCEPIHARFHPVLWEALVTHHVDLSDPERVCPRRANTSNAMKASRLPMKANT